MQYDWVIGAPVLWGSMWWSHFQGSECPVSIVHFNP